MRTPRSTPSYRRPFGVAPGVSPTVHDLRNEIRTRVGRFEREVDAQFTKEELAAVAEGLGADLEAGRPSKGTMRAAIRSRAGLADGDDADGSAFTKADLEAITEALEDG